MTALTRTQLTDKHQAALAVLRELVNTPERRDLMAPIKLKELPNGILGGTNALYLGPLGLIRSERCPGKGKQRFEEHGIKPALWLVAEFDLDSDELQSVLAQLRRAPKGRLTVFENDIMWIRRCRTDNKIIIRSKIGSRVTIQITVDDAGRFQFS